MAAYTLTKKADLASTDSFRQRVLQALVAKANVYLPQVPNNVAWEKQVNYGRFLTKGGAGSIDIVVMTRFWLQNYNGEPVEDNTFNPPQPNDDQILNSPGLDVVYNTMAGVLPGDQEIVIP